MKVPLSWLREFVEVTVEPERLAEDLSLAGLAVDGIERHEGDLVLDLDITTNRVDCMNVYGVAREVSVLYGVPLPPLKVAVPESGRPASEALQVTVEALDLCPRFCARVLDVRVQPSPAWLRERLEKVGVRPINTVVDVTNYVMMEMGHPSHAFDLLRVPESRLLVRWAHDGERLTTLDGIERSLSRTQGVVASPQGALALAGIMGGASSEVSEETRTVALEAAYWDPLSIRRAARSLGMRTEASHRFERGADPEGPPLATARIAHLLARIGAGSVRPGLIDRAAAQRSPRTVVFRPARAGALLGLPVPYQKAQTILGGLGFVIGSTEADGVAVEIPSWRGDVSREVDLIEEVARHHGLDKIPSTVPPGRGAEGLRPWQKRLRVAREALVDAGLREVVTYAFVSDRAAGPQVPPRVALQNPLSDEQAVLRSSLILPGLLGVLQSNLRRGRRDVRVFEVGRVFLGTEDDGPAGERERRGPGNAAGAQEWPVREAQRVALLLAGSEELHWSARPRRSDFYDAAGVLEVLARRLDMPSWELRSGGDVPGFLHPGKSAEVRAEGRPLGYVGALHPEVARAWELREEPMVAELDLQPLLQPRPPARFRPLPRFPAVTRDVAVVCGAEVAAASVQARIREAAGPALQEVAVADRYEGPPLSSGTVSLTFNLVFQDPGRTLTGDEVQAALARVVESLRRAGWQIRGE